ncbi:MAG: hypothetical protein Q8865_00350 [Bacillota bacterium]|nr:hypothetical protein [Bacillota bacterium]
MTIFNFLKKNDADKVFNVRYIPENSRVRKPQNIKLSFSPDHKSFLINGKKEVLISSVYVQGMSSDYMYHKVLISGNMFWIKPNEFYEFMQIVNNNAKPQNNVQTG